MAPRRWASELPSFAALPLRALPEYATPKGV
jgi:hypothetical protein